KGNIVHRELSRASRPANEFCRPPESVVKSCRARIGRQIVNISESSRPPRKMSPRKVYREKYLISQIFRQSFEVENPMKLTT
ncbi:MAG: hypothetical protein ACKO96_26795, partial [Flammeovirgaceae bacterium]